MNSAANLSLVTSFQQLDPPALMEAAEQAGFSPTGQFWQLNSYENRVFDLVLESGERVIAKFYRSGRWSKAAILEEHQFLFDLQKEGIPAVPPKILSNNQSLMQIGGLFVAFFPKQMGKMPDELLEKDFAQIGRRLAQIHNIGARKKFVERPVLTQTPFHMWENLGILSDWVAPEVWHRYEEVAILIIEQIEAEFANLPHLNQQFIRIHGDLHRGNLLLNPPNEYFFVDFDDCCMGPEVQDFWMLFSDWDSSTEKDLLLQGYEELRRPPREQFRWIPLLRGLRLQSYASWIARRWQDPSFPRIFPHFNTYNYWASETDSLWQCWRAFEAHHDE